MFAQRSCKILFYVLLFALNYQRFNTELLHLKVALTFTNQQRSLCTHNLTLPNDGETNCNVTFTRLHYRLPNET